MLNVLSYVKSLIFWIIIARVLRHAWQSYNNDTNNAWWLFKISRKELHVQKYESARVALFNNQK